MVRVSARAFASATFLAAMARAETHLLNFDDIQVSNEKSCGQGQIDADNAYHGVLAADLISTPLKIYNTTATAACHANTHDAVHVFDQKRATSGSNVAFSTTASFNFQVEDGSSFTNDASFDISVVLTKQEQAKDNLISVDVEIADFSSLDKVVGFTFHTAKDGFGPYHIHVPNSDKYIFLQVNAFVGVEGTKSFRVPTAFIDTLQLESIAN